MIAIVLTVTSMTLDYLLQGKNYFFEILGLSRFEKYSDQNEEFSSRVIKGFVLKFINSGVLVIFINYRIRFSKTIKIGNYDDFTPSWFVNIGYSVILAHILRIFSLLFWTVYLKLVPGLRRCWDRSCSCNKKNTKKKTLKAYIDLYMGSYYDIDYSYTEIINVLFVSFLFGTVLPIIYLISIFHLLLLFWKDKIMRKFPKN